MWQRVGGHHRKEAQFVPPVPLRAAPEEDFLKKIAKIFRCCCCSKEQEVREGGLRQFGFRETTVHSGHFVLGPQTTADNSPLPSPSSEQLRYLPAVESLESLSGEASPTISASPTGDEDLTFEFEKNKKTLEALSLFE